MKYRDRKTQTISLPLGGIGTGCIGLSGNGRLVEWEIQNRPNKNSLNGFSHFAIKAEAGGRVLDARVMNSDQLPPYTDPSGNGSGIYRDTMAGFPHFKDAVFDGEFPFAALKFKDQSFPGKVILHAFNPLIPLNDYDSSIPAAFFEVEIKNTNAFEVDYTVALSARNPLTKNNVNAPVGDDEITLLKMGSSKFGTDAPEYGDITIGTDAHLSSVQNYWSRTGHVALFWRQFIQPGALIARDYDAYAADADVPGGDTGAISGCLTIQPGETRRVKFVIAWSFPNHVNFWNPKKCDCAEGCCGDKSEQQMNMWTNWYATQWKDSSETAKYCLSEWDRLRTETEAYHEALFSSTLPEEVLDAVSANVSLLKSATTLRLTDGSFYGFEGCCLQTGCCEGSCTHVWNYAYALPYLFPKLERSLRELEYTHNLREDGMMSFRIMLPLGREQWDFHACADGQFGGVIKIYRDWKICGDTEWLRAWWPKVKLSLEWAWSETNEDKWDADKDGVLEGRQHHTLDTELFGANSYLTGFYLAALKAGAEMAEAMGESESAELYFSLFTSGQSYIQEHCFNGEYFHQLVDFTDKSILDRFADADAKFGSVHDAYWDAETQQIRHQIAEGCHIDQVVAQWHANLCGLGRIFDAKLTKKALQAIYKYNYKRTMRDFYNSWRIYAVNGEAATVICHWPDEGTKPYFPLTYAEEAMNGFEYQAGIHMIQEGLVKQGLDVVRAVRDRYDGEKRNPWNEFECGNNYARSMASFALLPTLSGMEFDMVKGHLGFAPVWWEDGKFRCMWSLDSGWGQVEFTSKNASIKLLGGQIKLNSLKLHGEKDMQPQSVNAAGVSVPFQYMQGVLSFPQGVELKAGESLQVSFSKK